MSKSREFFCEPLDELHLGTVQMHVPIVEGSIQIGAIGDTEVGAIRVTLGVKKLSIIRTDSSPLQAEIVEPVYASEPVTDINEKTLILRKSVFEEPIDELVLRKATDSVGQNYWFVPTSEDVKISDRSRLVEFVRTVGFFARAKQRKEFIRLRAASNIRRMLTR